MAHLAFLLDDRRDVARVRDVARRLRGRGGRATSAKVSGIEALTPARPKRWATRAAYGMAISDVRGNVTESR